MCNNNCTLDNSKIPTEEELQDTYTKTYRMQVAGFGETIRTSVPKEVVEREAKRHDLTILEFIEKFRIVWLYNGFTGAYANFVPVEKKEKKC